MFRDSIIAAVRTGIAALIGLLITWLVTKGIEVGPDVEANLNVALFGLFTALYNGLVIILERKVHPYFGILLGVPKSPAYGQVGTQTPPPAQPALGDNVPTDRGEISLAAAGIVVAVLGLLVYVLTVYQTVGIILLIVGAIVGVVGASRGGRL